jgi:hypothetical protein
MGAISYPLYPRASWGKAGAVLQLGWLAAERSEAPDCKRFEMLNLRAA